jgi:hypothetical protein
VTIGDKPEVQGWPSGGGMGEGRPPGGQHRYRCRRGRGRARSALTLSNRHWFGLKRRMWKLGSVVRLMHNCLNMPGSSFDKFSVLLRKSFRRIQWTMRDTFSSSTGTEEDDENDAEGNE